MALKRILLPVFMAASTTAVLMNNANEDEHQSMAAEVSKLKSQTDSLRDTADLRVDEIEAEMMNQSMDPEVVVSTFNTESSEGGILMCNHELRTILHKLRTADSRSVDKSSTMWASYIRGDLPLKPGFYNPDRKWSLLMDWRSVAPRIAFTKPTFEWGTEPYGWEDILAEFGMDMDDHDATPNIYSDDIASPKLNSTDNTLEDHPDWLKEDFKELKEWIGLTAENFKEHVKEMRPGGLIHNEFRFFTPALESVVGVASACDWDNKVECDTDETFAEVCAANKKEMAGLNMFRYTFQWDPRSKTHRKEAELVFVQTCTNHEAEARRDQDLNSHGITP